MKTLILVLALLMLMLCGQQQLKAAPKNDTGHEQAGKASSSVVLVKDNAPSHGDTAEAAQHQHATGKKPQPALLPPTRTDRFCLWLDSLNTADWTLIVTAAYLIATVLIWLAMLASNKHAEKTYKESKSAAEEDRKLLRRQLEVYERPWLTVSLLTGDRNEIGSTSFGFYSDGRAYVLGLRPVVRNIGKSLATDISIATQLVTVPRHSEALSMRRLLALRIGKPDAEKFTLFPGEEHNRLNVNLVVSKQDINDARFPEIDESGKERPHVAIAVIGVVLYSFANSDDPHQTQFAFLLGHKDAYGTYGVSESVRVGSTFYGDDIAWIKLPGDHAN
jgi:hypothetical protein